MKRTLVILLTLSFGLTLITSAKSQPDEVKEISGQEFMKILPLVDSFMVFLYQELTDSNIIKKSGFEVVVLERGPDLFWVEKKGKEYTIFLDMFILRKKPRTQLTATYIACRIESKSFGINPQEKHYADFSNCLSEKINLLLSRNSVSQEEFSMEKMQKKMDILKKYLLRHLKMLGEDSVEITISFLENKKEISESEILVCICSPEFQQTSSFKIGFSSLYNNTEKDIEGNSIYYLCKLMNEGNDPEVVEQCIIETQARLIKEQREY